MNKEDLKQAFLLWRERDKDEVECFIEEADYSIESQLAHLRTRINDTAFFLYLTGKYLTEEEE